MSDSDEDDLFAVEESDNESEKPSTPVKSAETNKKSNIIEENSKTSENSSQKMDVSEESSSEETNPRQDVAKDVQAPNEIISADNPQNIESDNDEAMFEDDDEVIENIIIPKVNRTEFNKDIACLKLPKTVHITEKLYNEEKYNETIEKEELLNLNKNSALMSEFIIRHREKKDMLGELIINNKTGKPELESNSKIVKFKDGSMQLFIGNICFDVLANTSGGSNGSSLNCDIFYSSTQDKVNDKLVLLSQGEIKKNLRLRPNFKNLQVFKELELQKKAKNIREIKIKTTKILQDDEGVQEKRAKMKEELLRSKMRSKRKTRKRPRRESFLDDDDDDEDEEEGRNRRGAKKTSHTFLSSSDENDDQSNDTDSSENEFTTIRSKKKGAKSVISSSSDSN